MEDPHEDNGSSRSARDDPEQISSPVVTCFPTFQCDDTQAFASREAKAFQDFMASAASGGAASKKDVLIQAVKDGELEVVRKTIRHCGGPDLTLDTADGYGNSLMHYAAFYGHAQLITFLARGGATVDSRNNVGNTPLQLACEAGREECVRLLVQQCEADVRVSNMTGWTPLHTAAFAGSVECVRVLVEGGADVQARSAAGSTPAEAGRDHPDIVALLACSMSGTSE